MLPYMCFLALTIAIGFADVAKALVFLERVLLIGASVGEGDVGCRSLERPARGSYGQVVAADSASKDKTDR
jgi:hypothetical protein